MIMEETVPKEKDVEVSKTKRWLKILFYFVFVLCFIGTVVGLPLALTLGKSDEQPPPPEPIFQGWREWSQWTDCSATCGDGESLRFRECISESNMEQEVCPGYIDGDENEIQSCNMVDCLSGSGMVQDTATELRDAGFEDNLFLNRYAAAVTLNGEVVNPAGAPDVGFGAWRLTKEQISQTVSQTNIKSAIGSSIGTNLSENLRGVCEQFDNVVIDIDSALIYANDNPCFSAVTFMTYLVINGYYPVPLDSKKQENILNQISKLVQQEWHIVMQDEFNGIIAICAQSDLDYAFVVDSSGSVGADNWATTMSMIGNEWVKKALKPLGAQQCGNHVAGRWFSSSTERFHDFAPPSKETYAPQSYADWTGDKFIQCPYNSGGTDTALALQQTRIEDIPTSRGPETIVMVFTDGQSNNFQQTADEAKKLHEVVGKVYAFGIGSGINADELDAIASHEDFVDTLTTFDQLEEFIRKFTLIQDGCKTERRRPHRAVDLTLMDLYGLSSDTAKPHSGTCPNVNSESCPSDEKMRSRDCHECSTLIAQNHWTALNEVLDEVTAATFEKCFPPEIILALISRLSIDENNQLVKSNDGWYDCKLSFYEGKRCYGVLQIPERYGPDSYLPDTVEYFDFGIELLVSLINQIGAEHSSYSNEERTRGGIAAYDCGTTQIRSNKCIDCATTNNDFSSDILSRAKYFSESMIMK